MSDSPLKIWNEHEDRVLRLQLARPSANIIDAAMIGALGRALGERAADPRLLAVVLDAAGRHFSFGASVEEHLPEQCAGMLRGFHALILQMLEYPVPILAAVRGQCLGGGLEVACAASLIFAAADARLGQPEISLAVFAPAASCLLPERLGQARAQMLLLSGQSIDAAEARQIGLVDVIDDDPVQAALAWVEENLLGKSAASLRYALRAARQDYCTRIGDKLRSVEALYLDELMHTPDPLEGLSAFLEKRAPVWQSDNRGESQ